MHTTNNAQALWDLLITDANIATMDPAVDAPYGAIENAAIAVKDGKIAWLGAQTDLPKFDALATPTVSKKKELIKIERKKTKLTRIKEKS